MYIIGVIRRAGNFPSCKFVYYADAEVGGADCTGNWWYSYQGITITFNNRFIRFQAAVSTRQGNPQGNHWWIDDDIPYSRLISRGENFEVFMDFAISLNFLHIRNLYACLAIILENLSAKSIYYPIHENFLPQN